MQHPEYEELYNLIEDPHESFNLALDQKNLNQITILQKLLDQKKSEILH
jgi:hypothetical protein